MTQLTLIYYELTCIRLSVANAYKQNKVLGVVVLKPSVKTDRQITVMSIKDGKFQKRFFLSPILPKNEQKYMPNFALDTF